MLFSISGAKLYIGGTISEKKVDFELSDFSSQTWVEITGHENLGSIGDVAREHEFHDIAAGRYVRVKGSRTATVMELVCGMDTSCAGQLALIAAEASRHNFAFRLVFDDAPLNGTPSSRLFIARVGSIVDAYDSGDEVVKFSAPLWINSNVVRINAAAPD